MAKGWRGEPRRKSLARRGIKTNINETQRFDVSNCVARGNNDDINLFKTQALKALQRTKEDSNRLIDTIIENEEPRFLTADESKELRKQFSNLSVGQVIISENHLLIPELSIKSWNYYAGFEYIEEAPERVGEYYVYDRHEASRANNVLDIIEDVYRSSD